jgi:uncharacterized protein
MIFVFHLLDRSDPQTIRADEPFTKAGLYETVSILQFRNMREQKAGFLY